MKPRRRLLLFLLLLLLAGALVALAAGRWASGRARAAADQSAAALARNHVGLLASELQKFRLLPLVLVEYPDVAAALHGGDAAAERRLDRTLELFAARTDAAALYAIDRRGRTVAASNWRLPTSFVGQDYGFRPYFTDAMRRGASELFALGTVSGRPGLYLARRVDRDGRPLGVIVVKVEFDRLEASWARSSGVSLVTDPHGVILVTSVPAWRFQATRPLTRATLADARRTLQFGATPPRRAPISLAGHGGIVRVGGQAIAYRVAHVPAPLAGGTLLHLAPLAPPLDAARLQALLWALSALLVAGAAAAISFRSTEKRRMEARVRDALEREVQHRTAELREADRRFRAAREELAQANRLGSLGQITAGVAHEINQPVAAIRTFAENAAVLLDRGAADGTRANLLHIVGLTDRIGAITGELRAFARRRRTPAMATPTLGSVLDGVALLLGERARGILMVGAAADLRDLSLAGDRIRLEQVLVNLVQNALEAVAGRDRPQIRLDAHRAAADRLAIHVRDNGTGVDPSVVDTLFTPFASARAEGLGLGLAIARDIARDFGGDLVLAATSAEGADFLLTLRLA